MADVAAIRQALADALGTLAGDGFQRSAYILANPTLPCVMIYAEETEFDKALDGGADDLNLIARVVVPFASDIASQMLLDEFRAGSGDRSFKAALEAEPTLGGACEDLRVVSVGADTVYGFNQGQSMGIGCEFRIYVLATH